MYYDHVGRSRKVVWPVGCLRKLTLTAWEHAFHDEIGSSAAGDCAADPALVVRAAPRFGDQKAVSADGERTRRAGGGPDDFIESDESVVEALKQFLVDPRKFAARHGEMAQFLGEQLAARYGAGQPTEEFVADIYQRAGQRPP